MGRGADTPISVELLGARFRFAAAPGLFSQDRVDDGTRLLLEHLPSAAPRSVLDLGCGYGALGLPIAARYREARCLLVDRDALAVEYAARNARSHGLSNVDARPSLGYRDVGDDRFDWILCNVPARIGGRALAYFLEEGAKRLAPGGELRVVVIRDLRGTVEEIAKGWPLVRRADGARHSVYGLSPLPGEPSTDHESVYVRDFVEVAGYTLERPADISEDPLHLTTGLPLLLELLPRAPGGRAFVWRGGYGGAAVLLAARGAQVLAADRDLLAAAFTVRNARRVGVEVETRTAPELSRAHAPEELFSLFAGELHPASDEAARAELQISARHLTVGGSALWLGAARKGRLVASAMAPGAHSRLLATRGPYSVWEMRR